MNTTLDDTGEDLFAYLVAPTRAPYRHTAISGYLLPPAPERRVDALLSRLGRTARPRPLSDGRLLWSCPGRAQPRNRVAGTLLPAADRCHLVHGNALITAGTPDWPHGLTTHQVELTRSELDAGELLLRQRTARHAAAAALAALARETGWPPNTIHALLHRRYGCDASRATPAQLDAVRDALLHI